MLFVFHFTLLAFGLIAGGDEQVRIWIEIKLQCSEWHLHQDAKGFLVADLLFPNGLAGNASGQHLLINAPAAAKKRNAALEFTDYAGGVLNAVRESQPRRGAIANLKESDRTQIHFAERMIGIDYLPFHRERLIAARVVNFAILDDVECGHGLKRVAPGGLRGGEQNLFALRQRFRRGCDDSLLGGTQIRREHIDLIERNFHILRVGEFFFD